MAESISKSKLEAKMPEICRRLEADGDELIVTDRRKPVLRIIPYMKNSAVDELFGSFQGKVVYHADIDTATIEAWSQLK